MPSKTPRTLGNENKYSIINLIRESGPISRADLARELGMSPPAISNNINSLIEANLIKVSGSGKATLGRKPILLQFNKEYKYVVSVDITENFLILAVADFTGALMKTTEHSINPKIGASSILRILKSKIHDIISEAKLTTKDIGVIVVSAPGLIDEKTGEIILATVIEGWEGVHLRLELEDEFDMSVLVENDIDMGIIGEHSAGLGKGHDNLLYIELGDGMACRIVLWGALYQGINNSAGEIGYMVVDKTQIQSKFSSRGPLEQRICNSRVDQEYRNACKLSGVNIDTTEMVTISKLIRMAKTGDETAAKILKEILEYLAIAIVNVVSVLDVELIILGGGIENLDPQYIDTLQEFAGRHLPYVPAIVTSDLKGMSGIIGGVFKGIDFLDDKLSDTW